MSLLLTLNISHLVHTFTNIIEIIMRGSFAFSMIIKTRPWRHIYHDIGIPRKKPHDIEIPRQKNHYIQIRGLKNHDIEKRRQVNHDIVFQGVFSEDKESRHRDSKTKIPRDRDSKTSSSCGILALIYPPLILSSQ